jgi:BirA family biotin operon repressor/biotin-[acetyl-CoA-carboxylase] ligase
MSADPAPFTDADVQRIASETWVQRIELHHQLRSTNDRALEIAAHRETETPLLILAEHQTHGRGRGSNLWWSAPGALTFSLLMDTPRAGRCPGPPPQVALAAGLAVCRALDQLLADCRPGLKWPNDVYLAGRKTCGILIEVPHAHGSRMVLGVGLNVNNSFANAPPEQRDVAISLIEVTGREQSRTELLIGLLNHLQQQLGLVPSDLGRLIGRCRDYCFLRGRMVQCHVRQRLMRGICLGIDDDGALLVETESGVLRCLGGQVDLV